MPGPEVGWAHTLMLRLKKMLDWGSVLPTCILDFLRIKALPNKKVPFCRWTRTDGHRKEHVLGPRWVNSDFHHMKYLIANASSLGSFGGVESHAGS